MKLDLKCCCTFYRGNEDFGGGGSKVGYCSAFYFRDNAAMPPKKLHILQLGATGKFAIHVTDDLIVVHQQQSKVRRSSALEGEGH